MLSLLRSKKIVSVLLYSVSFPKHFRQLILRTFDWIDIKCILPLLLLFKCFKLFLYCSPRGRWQEHVLPPTRHLRKFMKTVRSHLFWSPSVGLHVSITWMSIKLLFVIRSPLGLSMGRRFGTDTVVAAFNRHRKKMWSSVDVKLERGHLERIKKVLGSPTE